MIMRIHMRCIPKELFVWRSHVLADALGDNNFYIINDTHRGSVTVHDVSAILLYKLMTIDFGEHNCISRSVVDK